MEPAVYKSKISITLFVIVTTCLIVLPLLPLFTSTPTADEIAFIAVYMPIVVALEAFLYTGTSYTVDGEKLTVKSFLLKEEINIGDITSIAHTRTWLSAPALSFNRIELRYKRSRSIVISPRREEQFIARLKQSNPAIDVR